MKRLLCLLLSSLLLAGCQNISDDPSETKENSSAVTSPETTEKPIDYTKLAAKSEHFSVNHGMMSYFFRMTYDQYSSMAVYYGMDSKTSLKEQDCLLVGGTWFDFFAEETRLYVSDLLSLGEAAVDKGISLDDGDLQLITEQVESLKTQAAQYGCNLSQLLYALFGYDMTESELRESLRILALADKVTASFDGGFDTLTSADYERYYEEHIRDYASVDVMSFTVNTADFFDTEEQTAAEAAQSYIDRLSSAASTEEFTETAKDYMRSVLGLGDEDIEAMLADLVVSGVRFYNVTDETLGEWMFGAEKYSSMVYSASGASAEVLFRVGDLYRDESGTRNVRHLLFDVESFADDESLKEAAEGAYGEWEASGFDTTVFSELYGKYGGISEEKMDNVYKNVVEGAMVTELDAWFFADDRAVGDHALIESVYGWHLVEYLGESDLTVWEAEVREAIISEAFDHMILQYGESVVIDEEMLYAIKA